MPLPTWGMGVGPPDITQGLGLGGLIPVENSVTGQHEAVGVVVAIGPPTVSYAPAHKRRFRQVEGFTRRRLLREDEELILLLGG